MDYNYLEEDDKLSKLNSGGLINLRLDLLWKDAHKHSRAGLYSAWSADLDCIWSELGGEYEINSKQQQDFDNINRKLGFVKNWTNVVGFKRKSQEEKLEMARQYLVLRQKELFLRRMQNEQGKGTAYTDGSEDDWE